MPQDGPEMAPKWPKMVLSAENALTSHKKQPSENKTRTKPTDTSRVDTDRPEKDKKKREKEGASLADHGPWGTSRALNHF